VDDDYKAFLNLPLTQKHKTAKLTASRLLDLAFFVAISFLPYFLALMSLFFISGNIAFERG